MRTHLSWLCALTALGLAQIASAQSCPPIPSGEIAFQVQPATTRPQDSYFRVAGTYGFSVAWEHPSTVRLYATSPNQRKTWLDGAVRDLGEPAVQALIDRQPNPDLCPLTKNPEAPDWDLRCQEQIGLYWKHVDCARGTPCEWNDRWNAFEGTQNVSALPVEGLWPKPFSFDTDDIDDPINRVHENDFGISNYKPVLTRKAANAPPICGNDGCPPPTGFPACHPENPSAFAKGVANGKVVQVYYGGGNRRWFMAFNTTIKTINSSGSDRFRIAWASSSDGKTWTPHGTYLLRSTKEGSSNCRSEGFLLTDMFLDQGKFYLVFFELWTNKVYLARSPIAPFGSNPGHGTWEISGPMVNGKRTWKPLPSDGRKIDLTSPILGAAPLPIFPCPQMNGPLAQTDVNRVYVPGRSGAGLQPGLDYLYLALTVGPDNALQVWTAPTLEDPFIYQSSLTPTGASLTLGLFGWEFGLTQYPDNLDATPRLVGDRLDFWVVQNLSSQGPNAQVSVTRRTARLLGGIFGVP